MKDDHKKVEDLYKDAFSDFEVPGAGYDWNGIEKHLDKVKFYRLSLTHFNIYYSLLIATCFVASIITASHYFMVTVPYVKDHTTIVIKDKDSTSTLFQNKKGFKISNGDSEKNKKNIPSLKADPANESIKTNKYKNSPRNKDYAGAESASTSPDKNQPTNSSENPLVIPMPANKGTKDSIAIVAPMHHEKDSLKTRKEPKTSKKTIYITKQDTIFEYDTLKTKKNKKFKK